MAGRLLLSGAEGFTGRHLHRAALAQGLEVRALAADLRQPEEIVAELADDRFDHVIHLAAISAVTHARDLDFYEVNLFGTLNLLEALAGLSRPPAGVILASSANIYGNCPDSPIREDAPPAPVNHYAMSKLAMEHMSARYRDVFRLIVARPFNYTGVGHDERFVVPKLVRHFRERLPAIELGNLDVAREFNDVRAVCGAYLALLQHGGAGETYNICSGVAHSLQDVIACLENLTGHRPDVRVNPEFVRPNEVRRLCGDPGRLESRIGKLAHPPLADTLAWMLAGAEA